MHASPCWSAGRWVGPGPLGQELCAQLGDLAGTWTVGPAGAGGAGTQPEVLVDATAFLDDGQPAAAALAAVASPGRPRRIVVVVSAAWLGRGTDAVASARHAGAVAVTRQLALTLAPTPTTVNAVAVPVGFPGPAAPGAPVQVAIGVEDLAHVVRYLGHPDNGYVLGQVIALCGGDQVWSNHDL